jgi:type III secretion system FlhB-like substrate exporter
MTKEINKNVGLIYKGSSSLPSIVFKGSGVYADYYEKEFKKNKSSYRIVQDKDLLEKLSKLPVESEISPDLYELVAILLVHVYSMEIKMKGIKTDGSAKSNNNKYSI